MRVKGSVVLVEIVAPDLADELLSGESDTFVFYQIKQKLDFFWGQIHDFFIDLDNSCSKIDRKTFMSDIS